jgi:hypothetical protein
LGNIPGYSLVNPFISSLWLMMTAALSSNLITIPSLGRHNHFWRTMTPDLTFLRRVGLPFVIIMTMRSKTVKLRRPLRPLQEMTNIDLALELSAYWTTVPTGRATTMVNLVSCWPARSRLDLTDGRALVNFSNPSVSWAPPLQCFLDNFEMVLEAHIKYRAFGRASAWHRCLTLIPNFDSHRLLLLIEPLVAGQWWKSDRRLERRAKKIFLRVVSISSEKFMIASNSRISEQNDEPNPETDIDELAHCQIWYLQFDWEKPVQKEWYGEMASPEQNRTSK